MLRGQRRPLAVNREDTVSWNLRCASRSMTAHMPSVLMWRKAIGGRKRELRVIRHLECSGCTEDGRRA